MKLPAILSRTTGLMLATLAVLGLLLTACGPAATSSSTSEAASLASTTVPPTSVPAIATPALASTTTSVASPLAPRQTDELKTETAEPDASTSPIATPTGASSPEPPGASDAGVDTAYNIRPIEEISASGPPQIIDITSTDAVLIFDSSVPLACSVVYGRTTAYGLISVDQDMDGGAHTDHHPLLLGLEPDTEYHYRVQGSAPDGTLYIGGDGTFRTPPAEPKAEVNLASLEAGARVLAASSNFGGAANDGQWGANSAFDGSRGTAWSSDGDGDDAFVQVELAQPANLSAVEVWTRSMSDGTAQIFAFTLTTDTGQVLGPFSLKDAGQAYRFEVDAVAHSLRLDVVDSSGGNTGLIEFAVYGTPIEN